MADGIHALDTGDNNWQFLSTLPFRRACVWLALLAPALLNYFGMFWREEIQKRRVREGEEFNRDGHWCRDFSVRSDSWGVIEHWALEHGYYLVAMKSKRRVYQKGADENFYTTVLEVKHQDNRVVIAAYLRVGFRLRMLSLFLLPKELDIDPFGWKGIRVRRQACSDLNSLLTRLRQPEIAGTGGFHLLDLQMSTLILMGILPIPLVYFLFVGMLRFESHVGLTNLLLQTVGQSFIVLLGVAGTFLMLHHFAIARRYSPTYHWISTAVWSVAFSVLCAWLLTRTATEMVEKRITHHCIMHFNETKCQNALGTLPNRNQAKLLKKLEVFEKHLSTSVHADPSSIR